MLPPPDLVPAADPLQQGQSWPPDRALPASPRALLQGHHCGGGRGHGHDGYECEGAEHEAAEHALESLPREPQHICGRAAAQGAGLGRRGPGSEVPGEAEHHRLGRALAPELEAAARVDLPGKPRLSHATGDRGAGTGGGK